MAATMTRIGKEALEALGSGKVQWNILDKDNPWAWGVMRLLAQATIKRGVCTYAYSPELRRRLHNPPCRPASA
jgi:hypothetical protein